MPLKRIVAMAGDRVTFAAEGITVNGNPIIPKTAPEPKILQHCPFGTYTVPPNMIVAIGDHPDSWDARYLCWLPESLVFSTMQPVWVTR